MPHAHVYLTHTHIRTYLYTHTRRNSPRSIGQSSGEPLTLLDLLEDRLGLHIFKQWCRRLVVEENVLFWYVPPHSGV